MRPLGCVGQVDPSGGAKSGRYRTGWRPWTRGVLGLLVWVSVSDCGGEDGPAVPGPDEPVIIDTSGGTVTHQSGVVISAPAGAVTGTAAITVAETTSSADVTDEDRAGNIFLLGPAGTVFAAPVEVRLPWPTGFSGDPDDLVVFTTSSDGALELLDGIAVSEGSFVSGQTLHFSPFWASAAGARPTSILIAPTALTLKAGESKTLSATVNDLRGRALGAATVQWTSSDPSIGEVSAIGTVVGGRAGNTLITASFGGIAASVPVSVEPGPATSITLLPVASSVRVGDSQQFTASLLDVGNNDLGPPAGPAWTSSDPSIATVDSNGLASGLSLGVVDLRVEALGLTSSTPLQVLLPLSETGFHVSPEALSVRRDEAGQLSAQLVDDFGNVSASAAGWTSRDEGVVTVDGNGVVMGARVGSAWVLARDGTQVDSSLVTVLPKEAVSVDLSPTSLNLSVGEAADLVAVVRDRDGEEIAAELTWISSAAAVASVDEMGRVTAHSAGAVQISATASNGVSDQAVVRVVSREAVSLGVTPNPLSLAVGASVRLQATPFDALSKVTTLPPGQVVAWASSDESIVSVTTSGAVLGVAVGQATVTATSGSLSGQVLVTVTHGPAVAVQFTVPALEQIELGAGNQLQTKAVARDLSGNEFVDGLTYRSADPSVASVTNTGLVTGLVLGQTYIFVEINPADSFLVKVVPGSLSVVKISPVGTNLSALGASATFTANPADSKGNAVSGATFDWSLSNATVVTLVEDGSNRATVTAIGNGSVDLTVAATRDGIAKMAVVTVTVAVVPASVLISPNAHVLGAIAARVDLGPLTTVADGGGTAIPGASIVWTSLDPGIATVSATGVVTAVAPGAARIVATAGAVSDTATVSVVPRAASVEVTLATSLDVGGSSQATVQAKDSGGTAISAPSPQFVSSNPAVATVAASGLVTGISSGVIRITATVDGVSSSADLAVLAGTDIFSSSVVGGASPSFVPVGATFEVPVLVDMSRVSANGDLGSAQFNLDYDAQVFTYQSAITSVGGSADFRDDGSGRFAFAFAASTAVGNSVFTLVTVTFQVAPGAAVGTERAFALTYTATLTGTDFAALVNPIVLSGRVKVVQ
jgi:uncharacterized protein YjdB